MAQSFVRNQRSYEITPTANTIFPYQSSHTQTYKILTKTGPSNPFASYFRKLLTELKMGDQIECALDLMRRLPPQNTEENLSNLITLIPDHHEDLLNNVDQPLKVAKCKTKNRDYLLSPFNRDGDSYRSPWSNEYDPPISDGILPSPKTRKLEVSANDAFDTYRDMYVLNLIENQSYYEGGISSAYFWDESDGFSGAVLFKKAWDSIHVFKANERGRGAHYKLTSTVMLYTITSKPELGHMNLSGSMTRQFETDYPFDEPSSHIANIGRMVEDIELKMRNLLQDVYFGKTKDIVNDLRSVKSLVETQRQADIQKELLGKLMERKS
ncbi:1859_t:CDS:2 [Funneliformis caledonium]|uniref:F-actin-capping protein subunit beta n=1 Tax=Funneliformis caledonium TaxID=1117310 RepID=A0A9N8WDL8_9GLOM|nr:1859_t:CDS:2 [Funneliformis caledonium]